MFNPISIHSFVDKNAKIPERELQLFKKEMERLYPIELSIELIDGRDVRWTERNQKQYAHDEYVFEHTYPLYKKRQKLVDFVKFFVTDENFKQGNVRLNGFKLGRIFNSYYVTFTRFRRRDWWETAEHEILHAVDEFVKANGGFVLETLFGIKDFDKEIVHSQKYWKDQNYKYDEVWKKIAPYLSEAVKYRRLGFKLDLLRLIVSLYHQIKQQTQWNSNSIPAIEVKKMPTAKKYDSKLNAEAIVLHVDLGTEAGTINEILNGSKSASYNVYFPRHGQYVIEFVPLDQKSWHAGRVFEPTERAKNLVGGSDRLVSSGEPNLVALGACFEALTTSTEPTQAQIKLAVEYFRWKKIDHLPFIEHWQITSYKPKNVTKYLEAVVELLEVNK